MGSLLAALIIFINFKITFIDNSPSWQGNIFVKAISRKRKCGNSTENHTDSSCPSALPAKLSCKAKSLCFWVGNALKCPVCVCVVPWALTLLRLRSPMLRASCWISVSCSASRFCSFSFSARVSSSVRASCSGSLS